MEGKQFADDTAGQPLSTEYMVEIRGEQINQTPDQSVDRKVLLGEVHKIGATRLAGFLFWTNVAAIVVLIIGVAAPGWVTFKATHRLYYPKYSYHKTKEDDFKSLWVYQDYALFYVTQCTEFNDYTNDVHYTTCETMSYRTIDHLYRSKNTDYSKIQIGEKEITEDDRCVYRGAGLVMSTSKITHLQGIYTAGILLSLFTLYIWTCYRSKLASGNFTCFSRTRWFLMFAVSAVATIIIFAPVVTFAIVRAEVSTGENGNNFESSLGSVFAGFGGGFMALITIVVFMQLICCKNPGTYICSCTDESGPGVTVVED